MSKKNFIAENIKIVQNSIFDFGELYKMRAADSIVDVNNAKKIYEMAKEPKELHLIKGSDHLFFKKDPVMSIFSIFLSVKKFLLRYFFNLFEIFL